MNAKQYRLALRECADKATKSHPTKPELRSMLFIALLSAYAGHDEHALGDLLFNLTIGTNESTK
ncbi:hypothetical protein SAMN05518865_110190 [Duganella sp. CF458]|uniref:hypothetical protein n=1 Tax=Duganella sp. CF458 TaxID=1884368 RepID=UPI0008E68E52|nr:hypothetical protein [Duganella sp. CF458]SFG30156.1 hypothetical protein SAMN05518865_110190 [Duganella sp. CF458]